MAKQKILVIEDNPDMCDNIASILELADYQVITSMDGKSGVRLANEHKPDLILCDIMMPELDGYGVLMILSKNPHTASIPFIFLTAKADRSDMRIGMSLGADDYITKPFDSSDLLKVIEIRLKKHHLIQSSFEGDIKDVNEFFYKIKELSDLKNPHSSWPVRKIHKKDVIFLEGHHANELYFIKKGRVKTYKTSPDGKELLTGIYCTGKFAGYLPLLENSNYNETAVAIEDCELYAIPKEEFVSLVYSNKDIAKKFINLLTLTLEEAEQRLLDMAYMPVRQRVAWALINVCGKPCMIEHGNRIIMSRRDLSGLVGTATETLNRTLADFRDEGLIEISDDGIKVCDRRKLEKVAG